ncbi:MAG: NADH-quinone oxidoreductase subunit N [Thermodesulfobacteriota bacterium]
MACEIRLFLPELFYLIMALVLFFVTVADAEGRRAAWPIAFGFSIFGVIVTLVSYTGDSWLFFKAYKVDAFSQIFKAILAVGFALVVTACQKLEGVEERYQPEFFLFLTTCTVGMMLLVSSMELMTMYVALELSSFSLYILVPLRRGDDIDVEAGIKYLFVGVTASCIMLFGMSYVFGVTRTTYIAEVAVKMPHLLNQPGAVMGLLLLLSGFFFKLAVAPFHFWAPDVYQGAANQVTTYIATASKAAAVALLIRLTALGGASNVFLINVLIVLSVVSMTLGNLVAIVQKDLKRMLAYSAIAQAGYMLIGLLNMNSLGYSAAIFYTVAYMLMSFAAFLVVIQVASQGQDLKIADLAGLHKRAPLLALTLMLALFSLAGIPPTVGFTGKFLVFAAAVQNGLFWLAVIGMINATISLYYYLMVIRAAYLIEPEEEQPAIAVNGGLRLLNYGLIVVMVYLGVYPQQILGLADQAVRTILGGS